jgi:predicted secreted protein
MSLLTVAAVFFIIWWTVLFIVLPLGYRSQEEEGEVMLGTVESAPKAFRGGRVLLMTTVISIVIHLGYYAITTYFGFGIADIPNILPSFEN